MEKKKGELKFSSFDLPHTSKYLNALFPNVYACVRVRNDNVKLPPTDSQKLSVLYLPLFVATRCYTNATKTDWHTYPSFVTSVYVRENGGALRADKIVV